MTSFLFLSPLYLIGLLSAAIPLVIHLSRSRRTKKMRFSTTRFFTEQFLRSYRMSRLKELLLLACRMALFALLAMALSRPLFMPKGPAATAGSGARTVILVLDDSASMGYAEEGVTLFRRGAGSRFHGPANPGTGRHGLHRSGRSALDRAGGALHRADNRPRRGTTDN